MSRKRTSKPKSSKSKSSGKRKSTDGATSLLRRGLVAMGRLVARRSVLAACLIVAILIGGYAGLRAMERHVRRVRTSATPVRFHVRLVNLPDWAPPTLGRLVTRDLTPPETVRFEDEDLCRRIYRLAERCAWLGEIRGVRRVRLGATRGRVEVTAEFRRPVARVRYRGRSYFVDETGVVLPYSQTPKWAARMTADGTIRYFITDDAVPSHAHAVPIHYIVIDGVRTPPPETGRRWSADDLQAGLRLVELVNARHWANQITVVDVRNHGKRVSDSEPELRMYAQAGRGRPTDIRFGRFPHPGGGDWVISPQRKLNYLDTYVADHDGQLAGINSYIDVRFDELRLSIHTYEQ